MATTIEQQLRACGRYKLPEILNLNGIEYCRRQIFKHDFFAATSLYIRSATALKSPADSLNVPEKVVLKVARLGDFLGIPLKWLGFCLTNHEKFILKKLQGENGVPRFITNFGSNGLIYEYIEGLTLDERPEVPDDFFDRLEELLSRIHGRRIAYVDMNKRGNIILGSDGCPRLIDFQISWFFCRSFLGSRRLPNFLMNIFRRADFYHLKKHKRRLRSDLMSTQEIIQSRRTSRWIATHRTGTRHLTDIRRKILGYFYSSGKLSNHDGITVSPETDPKRWIK
ncbi:MAG: hypothetical protein JXD22_16175 [Sedimentisphaerales bacterium]|nr:hypothetical protein [Sedimentisphaerales bacterium]